MIRGITDGYPSLFLTIMPTGGNPKYSRPHRIPLGSRVFIVDNWTDPHHIKMDKTDYRGRTKNNLSNNEDAKMLSEYSRNNIYNA